MDPDVAAIQERLAALHLQGDGADAEQEWTWWWHEGEWWEWWGSSWWTWRPSSGWVEWPAVRLRSTQHGNPPKRQRRS